MKVYLLPKDYLEICYLVSKYFKIFSFIYYWTFVWFHCGCSVHSYDINSSKIWGLFYSSGHDLSWYMFHEPLKNMWVLPLLCGVFHKYWLDLVGWMHCSFLLYLIFCLVLQIAERGVLKSPLYLRICLFLFLVFVLFVLQCSCFVYTSWELLSSWWTGPFILI